MFPQSGLLLAFWLLWAAVANAQAGAGQPAADLPSTPLGNSAAAAEPIRMATVAFGVAPEVEVRDLPADEARLAVEAALTEIFTLGRLSDPQADEPGGVGALNRAAGQGPRAVDPRVAELLLRSLQFCIWSNGAYGPLGGELKALWRERRPPAAGDLRLAVGSAECSRLSLRSDESAVGAATTAELAPGSTLDLGGIARGFAVDRTIEILERHGARNVWVEIGNVWGSRGGGPDGRGWPAVLPPAPGDEEPLDRLWLRDQALAIVSLEPGGDQPSGPIVDQRTGVPPRGVVSVVAVTELAVDAEPLASALFILGHREGHLRLGTLNPRPSVHWLLGLGTGRPLEATYRWSELERDRRP